MFTTEQYKQGLAAIQSKKPSKYFDMLRAQYHAPNRTITATQMASAVGYEKFHSVNLHYGRLGRVLSTAIGAMPERRLDGTYRWWTVLSTGVYKGGFFLWTMHPALAVALEELNIVSDESSILPEEVLESAVFKEGAARWILVNSYERNSAARSICIAHHGTYCAVCGFDFGEMYGPIAEGYVHVHHLRPISEIGAEYQVDPIEDLRPVCPNCHAIIHLRKPPFSIEEVAQMLKQQDQN